MIQTTRCATCLVLLAAISCADPQPGTGEPSHLEGSFYILVTLGEWDVPRDGEAPGLRQGVDPRTFEARAVVRELMEPLPEVDFARFEVNGATFDRVKVVDEGAAWLLGGSVTPSHLPSSDQSFSVVLQTAEVHTMTTTMAMLEYTTLFTPVRGAEVSTHEDLLVSWLDARGDATDVVGLRASTFGALVVDGSPQAGSVDVASGATKVTLPAADLQDWYQRYVASEEAAVAGVVAGQPVNAEVMLSRRRRTGNTEPFLIGESVVTVEVASVAVVLAP